MYLNEQNMNSHVCLLGCKPSVSRPRACWLGHQYSCQGKQIKEAGHTWSMQGPGRCSPVVRNWDLEANCLGWRVFTTDQQRNLGHSLHSLVPRL